MSWNYRVVRCKTPKGETYLSIRTAWYDDGKDDPHSIGDLDMWPCDEENVENLRYDIQMMLQACDKPILDEADFLKKEDS